MAKCGEKGAGIGCFQSSVFNLQTIRRLARDYLLRAVFKV